MPSPTQPHPGRAQRLREATRDVHAALDAALMARESFASREGYASFLAMQLGFHRTVAPLYGDAALQAVLPGLADRCRLPLVLQDMADLGLDAPSPPLPAPPQPTLGAALGWLYVAEGSNLGAAVLRKLVMRIGLSDTFGARHLAPWGDGPAAHWRDFTDALDAVPLDAGQEAEAIAGARQAFAHVARLARID
ncbi:biliverdin-producing heme oxygenase [Novosphingobium capsulatum]|uniref:biliverdin-producing heme oxygenase n=1 Tax=Novosphingobium capsulatum TaxID=13688 RepID=UPI0007883CC0|nr:biliverdin-producing heme oxygenase [Novosphingobium capsulatum]WQD94596.1 biliverdin-producing heme oxygenase [Novosphingobium capsulatum]